MQKLTVRIISIAVLCALAAQAAACGETGGEKETSADSEQTTVPETESPMPIISASMTSAARISQCS